MTKMMLIDAVHPEEVRVAVVDRGQVEDFDFESAKKKQLRGNIYLAKITRVEPSLQAAFVDFGGNRHGFLAFNEIHPDYYQLPQSDREALLAEAAMSSGRDDDDPDDDGDERPRAQSNSMKRYKIQEVIRRRQIMLVQAVKEERGTKGAALTTYLSLAGRYCVLMPNTPRGGGISRKITNASDRKRLKKIVAELNVPDGMGLIVRTAGAKRTKSELKRDFEYLIRLWGKIRDLTLSSVAPCLINEEAGLVHRALRDLYDKDIDQVIVDGENAYREAKDLAKMLMPSHAKKVQQHRTGTPVFAEHQVETQLDSIFSPVVNLRSGGYLVIHQTEALVAIDVNSGKSTRERNIEQTALRTNLEAAEEACRQMRLRDLAGLVVIDFIDMEEGKNTRAVERKMKDCLRFDRARVQQNKISMFGLMEISRQRRRAGVLDTSSDPCAHCNGTGHIRSIESAALQLLRALENQSFGMDSGRIDAHAPTDVVLFLLNEKRHSITDIEQNHNLTILITARTDMLNGEFEIRAEDAEGKTVEPPKPQARPKYRPAPVIVSDDDEDEEEIEDEDDEVEEESPKERTSSSSSRRRSSRNRRDRRPDNLAVIDADGDDSDEEDNGPVSLVDPTSDDSLDGASRKRRRRGRRGGRRRRRDAPVNVIELDDDTQTEDGGAFLDEAASNIVALVGEDFSITATKIPADSELPQSDEDTPAEDVSPVESDAREDGRLPSEPEDVSSDMDNLTPVPEIKMEPEPERVPDPVSEPVAELTSGPVSEIKPEPAEVISEAKTEVVDSPTEPEPEPLPETEKPAQIRRGWWKKRDAG